MKRERLSGCGPRPKANTKGYKQIKTADGPKLLHVLVWEQHFGPVPPGYDVHHRNEDKSDFRIENLECLSKTDHKRHHSADCDFRDGVWWKRCRECDVWKPLDRTHWYWVYKKWPLVRRCRPCHIRYAVACKRQRRARAVSGGSV